MWSPSESCRICLVLHLMQNQDLIHYCQLKSDLLKKQGKKLKLLLHPDKWLVLECPSCHILLPDHAIGHKQAAMADLQESNPLIILPSDNQYKLHNAVAMTGQMLCRVLCTGNEMYPQLHCSLHCYTYGREPKILLQGQEVQPSNG